jgi:hypothetical protein
MTAIRNPDHREMSLFRTAPNGGRDMAATSAS